MQFEMDALKKQVDFLKENNKPGTKATGKPFGDQWLAGREYKKIFG